MKLLLLRRRRQGGNVLVLTVVVTGLVGFLLASYLGMVRTQNVSTMRSQDWNSAIAVVEAGLEEALAHLNAHGTTNLACDGWEQLGAEYVLQRTLGDNFYHLTIKNVAVSNSAPIIESRGYIRVPTLTASSQTLLLAAAGVSGPSSFYLSRGVRLSTRQDALFAKGLVAKGRIDLNGNNVATDSFDSSDPNYSTGGAYDPAKNKDKGDVATNSGLTNSLNVGNADIMGHVSTGPGGTISIGPNGSVGDKAWVTNGNNGIKAGWSSDDMNVSFPDVSIPYNNGVPPAGGTVDGVSYTYVLDSGKFQVNGNFSMSGNQKMRVTSNAVLYVTGNFSLSGNAYVEISPGASLKLYVAGSTASIGGNGIINNAGNALDFTYYGLPGNTSVSLGGNATFIGTVYAPNAALALNGGGSGDTDFVGAGMVGTATLNGHFKFHYDEALGVLGPFRGFVVTAWNEMTPQEVATVTPSF
jgi:hypothetical protein